MVQSNLHINTLKFLCCLSVFFVVSISAQAQPANTEDKNIVVYDPLLWKHELKLSADQRQKIQKINLEFYQSIYETANTQNSDHANLQSKANEFLEHRSQEIWNAFNASQRRKWKRMWDHHST